MVQTVSGTSTQSISTIPLVLTLQSFGGPLPDASVNIRCALPPVNVEGPQGIEGYSALVTAP
jgi:hypothetical protein